VRFKPSEALRFLGGLAVAAVVLGLIVLRVTGCAPARAPHPPAIAPGPATGPPSAAPSAPPPLPPTVAATACDTGPRAAAQVNAASLQTLAWAPFGRPETGWETYAPLIEREIGTGCPPQSPSFAGALAAWAQARRLPADGIFGEAVFNPMRDGLEMRRPFERVSARGVCPAPPAETALARAAPAEGYSGKAIQLRPGALTAWRAMASAARAEDPRIAADPRNLTIFSGFRGPADEAVRCAKPGDCNNRTRSTCSAHRTGLAMDLYVGQAPGFGPDSSADANRLFMSRTPTYRWLVAHADRFGFVPYPFEPWHWEWTGEAP
jgi:D-alanyl-D-alanine carboxypeptidase